MISLVYGHDAAVAAWVGRRIGIADFGPSAAIGIAEGGRLIAGVVYGAWRPAPGSLEMSIAAATPRWCGRRVLAALFAYPFARLGAVRVQATIRRGNRPARRFVERLGFRYEGMARAAWPTGEDAAVYSMLRHECRWVRHQRPGIRGRISDAGTAADP